MDGEDIKTGENAQGGENLETLKSQLDAMKSEFEQLKSAKSDLEKKLDDADKELLSPEYLEFLESRKGAARTGTGTVMEEEVNFDEMTPSQIAKHFEKQYKGSLKSTSDELTKRIQLIEEGISNMAAQIDLTITAMKHPDLETALNTPSTQRTSDQKDLVERMYKVAMDNPTWPSEKCYRTAQMERRAEMEEKQEREREQAEKERKTLSEKPGAVESILQGKQISKDEAAQKAWSAAFGKKTSVD